MSQNQLTILTIFVNPTQFAPHEDLSSYPRTMASDLKALEGVLASRGVRDRGWNRTVDESVDEKSDEKKNEEDKEVVAGLSGRISSATFPAEHPPPPPSLFPIQPPSTFPSSSNISSSSSASPSHSTRSSESNTNQSLTRHSLSSPPYRGLGISESDPSRSYSANNLPPPAEESGLVVFAPGREVMYPLSGEEWAPEEGGSEGKEGGEGMLQDVKKQRGAFVEVKGWGDVMEGKSRRE